MTLKTGFIDYLIERVSEMPEADLINDCQNYPSTAADNINRLIMHIHSMRELFSEACDMLGDKDICCVDSWDMHDDWECPHDNTDYSCAACWCDHILNKKEF